MEIQIIKKGCFLTSDIKTLYYNDFNSLKKEVIKVLDSCGWYDKNNVDLRSIKSCIHYLYEDFYIKKINGKRI